MSTQLKLGLSVAAVAVAGFVGVGFAFYFAEDNVETKSRSTVSWSRSNSLAHGKFSALKVSDAAASKASVNSTSSESGQVKTSPTAGTNFDLYDSASAVRHSSDAVGSTAPTLIGDPEVEWAHIPVAFLNYAGVLPATPEVTAAIQHIQNEFVDATGAGSVSPTDPGFGQAWEWAQPTADEEFYAIFGIEAFNQMSIMEARERGHF